MSFTLFSDQGYPLSTSQMDANWDSRQISIIDDVSNVSAARGGLVDISTEINAAITAAYNLGYSSVAVPYGRYKTTSDIVMKPGVDIIGEGGLASVIVATGCNGFTYDFTSGFGNSRIIGIGLEGALSTTKFGIYQAGTLDDADELYGITIRDCLIRGFNIPIKFRTVRNVTIENNWLQDCNSGIHLVGKCLVLNINKNKIVYAAGNGSGTQYGIYADYFNYTSGTGQVRPETVRIVDNHIYGFTTGVAMEGVVYGSILDNDIEALTTGVSYSTASGVLNINDNYIEVDGAASLYGVFGKAQGSVLDTQINIERNKIISTGGAAATSIGVALGTALAGNQDNVRVIGNAISGFTKYDIANFASGHNHIRENSCYSTAVTNSIYTTLTPANRPVYIEHNDCYSTIAYDAADFNSGLLQLGKNIINQTTASLGNVGSLGGWITPTFSAGDYTANDAMTWTVAAGDVTTFQYTIVGKMMTVNFVLSTTSVGGTPSSQLKITIPASKTAVARAANSIFLIDNNVNSNGWCDVSAGGTTINIRRTDAANYTASAAATSAYGTITFEI